MANKILITSVFAILISSVNVFAGTNSVVDPEKEQSKTKKASVIIKNSDDTFIQKGVYIKEHLKAIEEDSVKKKEVKEEKPKETTKEDVQSFNFLYYILQSKFSDFATY
ncbi:MAG: hypothetical protein ACNS60_03995 [Candidatus Cyclobacteriaceae bacterium M2_1C_046]